MIPLQLVLRIVMAGVAGWMLRAAIAELDLVHFVPQHPGRRNAIVDSVFAVVCFVTAVLP